MAKSVDPALGTGAVAEGADPEAERVQVDEPLGVPLTVDGVRFERGEVGPVEGAWRAAADDDDVALVEPDPHRARDVARALVHQGLERLALGREPEAVVDHLGVAWHEGVAQMERLAVERERLERPARDVHDRAAGCLVHAPRLHSDEPVLDEVDAPDSVLAAQPVEPGEERDGSSRSPSTVTGSPRSKSISTGTAASG